jgi:hypothetical protein
MNQTQDIKDVLHSTVHENVKPVKVIADEIGISSNYLYRAALPDDESGVKFPIQFLIPLMKSTNNYSLLRHIAKVSGFLTVKMPLMTANKKDELEIVDEYQDATVKVLKALKTFFNEPTSINYNLVDQALLDVMEKSSSAQKYCEKRLLGQLEMEM